MAKELKIELVEKTPDGIYVFRISGALGVQGAAGIQGLFDVCLREDVYRIILDLEEVNFISSAGMGAFLSSAGELRKNGGDIIFVKMQNKIQGVFKNLDVFDYFITAADSEEAKSRFRSGRLPRPPSIEELTGGVRERLPDEEFGKARAIYSLVAAYTDIFDGDAPLSDKVSQIVDITANYLAVGRCAFVPLAEDLGLGLTTSGDEVPLPAKDVAATLAVGLSGKTLVAVERFEGINRKTADWFAAGGARFLFPLGAAERPRAVFFVSDKKTGETISADEKRVLRYLRSSLNLALRSYDLERGLETSSGSKKRMERKLMEMETLFLVSQELAAAVDVDKMLPTFLMMVTGQFGTDRAVILLETAKGRLEVRAARGLEEEDLLALELPARGLVKQLDAAGEPAVSSHMERMLSEDERKQLAPFLEHNIAILAPMRFKNRTIGVVGLGAKISEREYQHDEQQLFGALVNLAAVSIETARLLEKMKGTYSGVTRALVSAMEAKDKYTRGHTERVTRYAAALAAALDLDEDENQNLLFGAVLHDIGYIGVSEEALRMPDGISEEQMAEIRRHPGIGANILKDITFLEKALDAVRHHHEAYDGSGYPDGLAGDDIPLSARVIAVVDAFDAMTSERRYRQAKSPAEAVAELRKNAGAQFDPAIVDKFVRLVEDAKVELIKTKD